MDTGGVTARVYIGGYCEQTGEASRSYCYLGGTCVAVRESGMCITRRWERKALLPSEVVPRPASAHLGSWLAWLRLKS